MTTDPNWLKSITESYKQEVSESARNLQEKAEDLYNLVETIQTALNVDLTEAQVDALIEAFRSTLNPHTGGHTQGLLRSIWSRVGGKSMSSKNRAKQSKIHGEIDTHNDYIDRQNTEIEAKNKEVQADHDSSNQSVLAAHAARTPRDTSKKRSADGGRGHYESQGEWDDRYDPDGSWEKIRDHEKERDRLKADQAASRPARLTPKISQESKRVKRN